MPTGEGPESSPDSQSFFVDCQATVLVFGLDALSRDDLARLTEEQQASLVQISSALRATPEEGYQSPWPENWQPPPLEPLMHMDIADADPLDVVIRATRIHGVRALWDKEWVDELPIDGDLKARLLSRLFDTGGVLLAFLKRNLTEGHPEDEAAPVVDLAERRIFGKDGKPSFE